MAYPKKDSFKAKISESATFTEMRKLGQNIPIETILQLAITQQRRKKSTGYKFIFNPKSLPKQSYPIATPAQPRSTLIHATKTCRMDQYI